MDAKDLSWQIIGAAIEVHKELGPGLLESTYEHCLAQEFELRKIPFSRQKALQVLYKGKSIDCAYRLDFIVRNEIIVELKAVENIIPIHEAQLLTYLKLTRLKIGLLFNFNVIRLKNGGIKRLVLNL